MKSIDQTCFTIVPKSTPLITLRLLGINNVWYSDQQRVELLKINNLLRRVTSISFIHTNAPSYFLSLHSSSEFEYGPFLLKLPYYHQKMYLVFDIFCFYKFYIFLHDKYIMDRCIYLNQDHFVTKLNNGF